MTSIYNDDRIAQPVGLTGPSLLGPFGAIREWYYTVAPDPTQVVAYRWYNAFMGDGATDAESAWTIQFREPDQLGQTQAWLFYYSVVHGNEAGNTITGLDSSVIAEIEQYIQLHGLVSYFGDAPLFGTGDDYLNGEGGDDTLLGRGGDDILDGGTGDDQIDGGEGIDIALYKFRNDNSARFSTSWQITYEDNAFVLRYNNETDRLVGVETVRFLDADIQLAVPHAPSITSDGGNESADLMLPENSTIVTQVVAEDLDPESIVHYELSGGVDQSKFTIEPESGLLRFISPPNYEAPTDDNGDNVYVVQVRATDGVLYDDQLMRIAISDVLVEQIVGTLTQLAAAIEIEYWEATGRTPHHFAAGSITINVDALSPEAQHLARLAFRSWEDVANVHFVETFDAAQITFLQPSTGGANTGVDSFFGYVPNDYSAIISIPTSWISQYGTLIGSYSFETFIHEIGHALGLGHGGPYNGSVPQEYLPHYLNETRQYTVMSYLPQFNYDGSSNVHLSSPQLADIFAVGHLYGAATLTRLEDNVYGFHSNAGVRFDFESYDTNGDRAPGFTIYDNGGVDTLDCSGFVASQLIDLASGAFSSIGGFRNNIAIGTNIVIENAVGGSGDDDILGNSVNNRLTGGAGNDNLDGKGGDDSMAGGAGDDSYVVDSPGDQVVEFLGEGVDKVFTALDRYSLPDNVENLAIFGDGAGHFVSGNAGANVIESGVGNDAIFGNAGHDTLLGGGGGDTLVGNDDPFAQESDILNGGDGDDTLYGEFTDTIIGGIGRDVLYAVNEYAWTIDLGATSIEYMLAGFGNDTIDAATQTVAVEIYAGGGNDVVTGSAFNDFLWAGVGNDVVNGGEGDDMLFGDVGADSLSGGGGNDSLYVDGDDILIDGGAGFDAVYITSSTGMTFNMAAQGIEWVADFASGADTVNGAALAFDMTAYAGGGTDVITGGSGNDFLWGEADADTITGNNGNDVLVGGTGADVLTGGAGTDVVYMNSGGGSDGVQDRVVMTTGWGTDFVFDFVHGEDKIDMTALGTSFGVLNITNSFGHAYIHIGAGTDLIAVANNGGLLSAEDFLF